MYEDICYKKNFLKEVIARIDFAASIDSLEKNLVAKIANKAVLRFPISEPRKKHAQALEVSPDAFKHKRTEFTEWNYYGKEREKRLVITPSTAFVTYNKYSTFERLKEDFIIIIESIFNTYTETKASRFGLRYINNFEFKLNDPLKWDSYFNNDLLGLFNKFSDRHHLARLFHIIEFKHEDIFIKFQFGVPNPDFPAVIKKPLFVIDLDGYVQGLQDLTDIKNNLDAIHDEHIQRIFEDSITDKLRKIMKRRIMNE